MTSWSVKDRAGLFALLAPGGRHHENVVPPDGVWIRHVEYHIAQRDGELERAAAIEAATNARVAERLNRLTQHIRR
jgi:hypothetical protein